MSPTSRPGAVLYVEDEENDVLFMQRAFASAGINLALHVVEDGRAAIKYLSGVNGYGDRREHPVPALVLLDLNLPAVPGFEVLKWMRSHPDYGATPVVIFSSSTRNEDKVRARQLGADEFVEKPTSAVKFGPIVAELKKRWLLD